MMGDSASRTVSRQELFAADGTRGRSKWVAFNRKVYDVTDCPKWRADLHENLHFPGQDLTAELNDAPHATEVFEYPCVRFVGILSD